ncbi:hypothetical protein R1sor_016069 [Riccia sorocarpa]|uniref:ATP-dependent Clp protease proteolytic subunit n=1 Tax=Riccia sorocarpa TaxID=122646 RepID=A0ABD3HDZ4_9MARC
MASTGVMASALPSCACSGFHGGQVGSRNELKGYGLKTDKNFIAVRKRGAITVASLGWQGSSNSRDNFRSRGDGLLNQQLSLLPSDAHSRNLDFRCGSLDIRAAKKGAPALMPLVMTPTGPADLSTVLLRNRIVFVGSPVNSQVAQKVISQLLTLAAIDEEQEIKMYINCPGGSTYSVLAIYDTMSWIKPKVSTVCFGIAASQGALLLAGGAKGRRFAMPNARIMIHQPQGGCGGTADDVRRQVNEVMQSRDKIDKMYAAFTGQPLERVQNFTDRDRFFSAAEAMEFGLIDGLLETEY